jgi:hypothetical protein
MLSAGNIICQDSLTTVADTTLALTAQDSTVNTVLVKKTVFKKKRRLVFAKVKCGGKSFLVASPKGWVLDDKSGKDQGLDVVLYPEGWNLDYAPALMYTKIINKDNALQKSFADIISEQVDQLKQYGATIVKDSIAYTYDNKQSVIINFIDNTTKTNNLISYINEYNYIVSFILTSRDKDQFLKSKPKFLELVNSYKIN